MAYTSIVTDKRDMHSNNIYEFVLDTEADLANIPTWATAGSTAVLVDASKTWTKAPSGTWTLHT